MAGDPIMVLLVEDDEEDYMITRELLCDGGRLDLEVVWARSLQEGLAKLKTTAVQVVLLDLNLPDSSGWETFEAAHANAPDAPIILLTGLSDEALGIQSVQKGAQDYLVKGRIDGDRLRRAIRYAIERKRAEVSLKHYQDGLEELVNARTAELQRTNEQLQAEIGERKTVESMLRDAIARLEEHDRAKTQFVSNVSHELKTPLSSISYAVDNMLKGVIGPIPTRVQSYLEMLRDDSERLKGTVSDILDLSRIESNCLQLNRRRLSLARLVHQTAGSLGVQAEAERLNLRFELADGDGFVECDPHKIERLILNVVQNAIKFTAEDGTITVTVRRIEDGKTMALDVVDDGIGIPEEFLERVTERYFRIGEHVTGSGLGLALCKEIIELHGGRIEVHSPPLGKEKGTQVSLMLPAVEPPRVIVISCDDDAAAAFMQALAKHGYRVQRCGTVAEALSLAGLEPPPDAVMLDLARPGLQGVEVLAALRSGPQGIGLPVLVATEEQPDRAKSQLIDALKATVVRGKWEADELVVDLEEAIISRTKS
jgi:signal transduction histidine kinase